MLLGLGGFVRGWVRERGVPAVRSVPVTPPPCTFRRRVGDKGLTGFLSETGKKRPVGKGEGGRELRQALAAQTPS